MKSAVGVVNRLWPGRSGFRIPAERSLWFVQNIQTCSEVYQFS